MRNAALPGARLPLGGYLGIQMVTSKPAPAEVAAEASAADA
jgi:hypothetical protein